MLFLRRLNGAVIHVHSLCVQTFFLVADSGFPFDSKKRWLA